MNKHDAKAMAESGSVTWGELRQMIALSRGRGGMSKVNSTITHQQALDIFLAAIDGRADEERPSGFRWSAARDKQVRTGDSLIVQNILRECA